MIALFICATAVFAHGSGRAVVLLPFNTIGRDDMRWVGDAVQQSLQGDLRNATLSRDPNTGDPARIARTSSADFVISGSVQIVEDQVRLTAIVFNAMGATIATAKATGDVRRLFDLEDALAEQIRDGIDRAAPAHRLAKTPVPTMQGSAPIRIADAKPLPLGTVPESYSSPALRDGRDRYLYQIPFFGCFDGCGYGACFGGYGFGGFGFGGFGGGVNIGFATGGTQTTGW